MTARHYKCSMTTLRDSPSHSRNRCVTSLALPYPVPALYQDATSMRESIDLQCISIDNNVVLPEVIVAKYVISLGQVYPRLLTFHMCIRTRQRQGCGITCELGLYYLRSILDRGLKQTQITDYFPRVQIVSCLAERLLLLPRPNTCSDAHQRLIVRHPGKSSTF